MPVLPKILRLEPRNVVPWSLLPLVGEIPHPIYLVVSELPAPSWPLRCGNVSCLESGPFFKLPRASLTKKTSLTAVAGRDLCPLNRQASWTCWAVRPCSVLSYSLVIFSRVCPVCPGSLTFAEVLSHPSSPSGVGRSMRKTLELLPKMVVLAVQGRLSHPRGPVWSCATQGPSPFLCPD